jgi:hypothetical protein
MENYKTTRNFNPDKNEKMALGYSYRQETRRIHTEIGKRLEPPAGWRARPSQKKTWKRKVEQETTEVAKTLKEVKICYCPSRYLNCATISKDLLLIMKSRFCRAF